MFWSIIEEMKSIVDVNSCIIIPNWNGIDSLAECIESLLNQSVGCHIIVVDNGSTDGSVELIEKNYPLIELIKHSTNLGYAGGVNSGILRALKIGVKYVAPFNNDAIADKDWLKNLLKALEDGGSIGIAASKLLTRSGENIDSTGECYTTWGLPFSRGRGDSDTDKYDAQVDIFAASGGASLYRVSMLKEIGLFDEDFFAYYEDVDLGFRAQLAGWKVLYVPASIVYHQIGATSGRIKGFTTYQTLKNLPLLLFKNVPRKYLFYVGRRYTLAHFLFYFRAVSRGQVLPAIKGDSKGMWLVLTGYGKRRKIQRAKKVSDEYIWGMMVHDLPPKAVALRKLRDRWRKLF